MLLNLLIDVRQQIHRVFNRNGAFVNPDVVISPVRLNKHSCEFSMGSFRRLIANIKRIVIRQQLIGRI